MVKAVEASKKPKHVWLLAFGILLLLIGFGYKAYIWYQLREDKQRFEETSVLVDKIYSNIVAELGQPEDSKRTNSCSRPYQEFTGYGEWNCISAISFLYGVENIDGATNLMRDAQRIISAQPNVILKGVSVNQIFEREVANSIYKIAGDEYRYSRMTCVTNYVFDTPEETRLKLKSSKKSFEVSFSCFGPAKSEVYLTLQ